MSTAQDYLRFMNMLRNGGELEGVRVLKPETVVQMVTNKLPSSMIPIVLAGITLEGIGYGLGLGVCVGDSDWAGGMGKGTYWWLGYDGTCAWYDPQRDLIGVYVTQAVFYHKPSIVNMNIVNRIVPME